MSQTKLNPEQALAILEQATAQVTLNRYGHMQVIEAIKVLAESIQELKKFQSQDRNASPSEPLQGTGE